MSKNIREIEKSTYFAIFKKIDNGYKIRFDNMDCSLECSDSIPDGIKKAKEALELYLWNLHESGKELPEPIEPNIKLNKGDFITPICIYISLMIEKMEQKSFKKTLTIPYWLNKLAESEKINFSEVLQDALKKELNVEIKYLKKE